MNFFEQKHCDALTEIERWLERSYPEARRASQADLGVHGLDSKYQGWVVPLTSGVTLILAVDEKFPFSRPKTALAGQPSAVLDPHVEEQQRLCTFGDAATFDTGKPAEVVEAYLNASAALLAENEAGGDIGDYSVDFEAYWRRGVTRSLRLLSAVRLQPPSRPLVAWEGDGKIFLAETAEDSKRWLSNRYGGHKARTTRPAALIWIDQLPDPTDYPDDPSSLLKLVERQAASALPTLERLLASSEGRRVVLLAGPATAARNAGGGVIIDAAASPKSFNKARPSHHGFRKGKVPPAIIAARSRSKRTDVQQVDASRTRLEVGVFQSLRDRKVAILGCGSLGAGVATLLAQSGVGRLLLVDPDTLRWENIGRHELGAADVDKNKATSLASQLQARLPHLIECEGKPGDWVQLARQNEGFLDDCDVVASLMGDWLSESALDDFTRSRAQSLPVVYGWLERRAVAAHALALSKNTSCFRCGFDPTGEPLLAASSWWKDEDNEQCAGVSSPYGATELACGQALVSGLIIDLLLNRAAAPAHRVWLGRTAELERQGGYWSKAWRDAVGDPGGGAIMLGASWPQDDGCSCA